MNSGRLHCKIMTTNELSLCPVYDGAQCIKKSVKPSVHCEWPFSWPVCIILVWSGVVKLFLLVLWSVLAQPSVGCYMCIISEEALHKWSVHLDGYTWFWVTFICSGSHCASLYAISTDDLDITVCSEIGYKDTKSWV